MLFYYLKFALRHMLKEKGSTLLNILGLSVGFTSVFFISWWIFYEATYNSFPNVENLYLVTSRSKGENDFRARSPFAFPNYEAYRQYPEVQKYVSTVNLNDCRIKINDVAFSANGISATMSFMHVFDVKAIRGNLASFNDSSRVIFITERLAKRLFNSTDIIGRVLDFSYPKNTELVVGGVICVPPANSSFSYDFIIPYFAEPHWARMSKDYIVLNPQTDFTAFKAKFFTLGKATQYYGADGLMVLETSIFPFTDIYFYSTFSDFAHGNISYVWILFWTGLIVFLATLVNYINLTSSQIASRSKEISMRKIMGSQPIDFYTQLVMEAGIYFLLATIITSVAVLLFDSSFREIVGKELLSGASHSTRNIVYLILLLLVVSLLSGMALAQLVVRANPLKLLKGQIGGGLLLSSFKQKLLVFQLVVAVAGIAATLVIDGQVKFMLGKDPGYDRENIVKVNLVGNDFLEEKVDAQDKKVAYIDGELDKASFIIDYDRGDFPTSTLLFPWKMKPEKEAQEINTLAVGSNFFDLFHLKIKHGEVLKHGGPLVILNETAVRTFAIRDPLGYKIYNSSWGQFSVIGIVEDYNFESTGIPIKPLVIVCQPYLDRPLLVKIARGKTPEALAYLQRIHATLNPGLDFQYRFFDEEFNSIYRRDQIMAKLFNASAFVCIVISMLGLLSVVLVVVRERIREIGIRKVFGASVWEVMILFGKYFIKRLMIAFVIGSLISSYAMSKWLDFFSNKINLTVWTFLLAGLIVLSLSIITIGYHVLKAAQANPIDSLRQGE